MGCSIIRPRTGRVAAALLLLVALLPAGTRSTLAARGARRFRVGLVLDPPGVTDPYMRGAFVGLQRAVRELGVEGRVLVPSPREGFLPSITSLAQQGYDLVFGLGVHQIEAIDAAAPRFPRTRFAMLNASWSLLHRHPRNVRGIVFRSEEGGYLAGYLAALLERRQPGPDVISAVGGYKMPTVDRFIAGYEAGARRADPGIRTLTGYANSFLDPARCASVADDQIAKGSGVVFQVAGGCGLGALRAARAKGAWAIGVDVDQSALGPQVLTSVVKRLDVAVFETVRAAEQGRLRTGGDAVLGLRDHGVDLGVISTRVPRPLVAAVQGVRRRIVSGAIRDIPMVLR
jgi:basic membrane protein A